MEVVSEAGEVLLARRLIEHDLVDGYRLLIFPVIVGAGRRLFPDSGVATGLTLVDSRTAGKGVVIHVYRPTGRPEFGSIEVGLRAGPPVATADVYATAEGEADGADPDPRSMLASHLTDKT